jgi:hypothetical protein
VTAQVPLFSLCAGVSMVTGMWFSRVCSTKSGRELLAEARQKLA